MKFIINFHILSFLEPSDLQSTISTTNLLSNADATSIANGTTRHRNVSYSSSDDEEMVQPNGTAPSGCGVGNGNCCSSSSNQTTIVVDIEDLLNRRNNAASNNKTTNDIQSSPSTDQFEDECVNNIKKKTIFLKALLKL